MVWELDRIHAFDMMVYAHACPHQSQNVWGLRSSCRKQAMLHSVQTRDAAAANAPSEHYRHSQLHTGLTRFQGISIVSELVSMSLQVCCPTGSGLWYQLCSAIVGHMWLQVELHLLHCHKPGIFGSQLRHPSARGPVQRIK